MKKNLFILAAAALAFTACSSDETIAVNEGLADANTISFRPLTTGITRAADQTFTHATNDATFAVTAWKQGTTSTATNLYINNAIFKSNGTSFKSQTGVYYWPSDYNLDFYAYAPTDDGVANQAVDYVAYNSLKVTPGTTISSQTDLVFAVTKDWGKADLQTGTPATHAISSTYPGVTINFAHAESKIIIKLKNDNPNIKVTIGDVKIKNLYGAGTYTWTVGTNKYTDDTTPKDVTDYVSTSYYLNGSWAMDGSANVYYTIPMGTDNITDDAPATIARNIFNGTQDARDLTSTATSHEMILIPQAITAGDEYESASNDAVYGKAYISVELKIQNKENDAYIVGSSGAYQEAIWPLTDLTWKAGHSYTYTVNLAGGGYFPDNVDGTDAKLDPILKGAEIEFVAVSIDSWISAAGIDVGM